MIKESPSIQGMVLIVLSIAVKWGVFFSLELLRFHGSSACVVSIRSHPPPSLVIYIMLFQFSQSNNDALDNKLMVPRDSSGLNDLCTDRRIGFAVFFFFSLFCIWVWKNWCKNIWCGLISTSTYKLSEFVAYYLLAFMRFCMILELIGCVLVILSPAGDQPFDNGGKEQWWLE